MSNREGSLYEIIESSTPKRNAVQGNAQADESCRSTYPPCQSRTVYDGIVPSAPRIPKDNGKRKCSSCQYRQTDKNLGNCAYIEIMGHTRGCNAIECDKYVKGKPLKKRKDSGAKMVNEDPKERVEEVK